MNPTTAGRIVALVLFSAVAALLIFAVLSSRQTPQQSATSADAERPPDEWASFDANSASDIIAAGEQWIYRRASADGTVSYEITADRLDPEAGGRFSLEQPSAWIFMGQARVRVEAKSGRLLMPSGAEPQAGRLDGGVVIDIFDDAEWRAFEQDETLLEPMSLATIRTSTIDFEATLGQVEAPGTVTIENDAISFEGTGLLARIAELQTGPSSRHRLNFFRVSRGREARVSPSRLDALLARLRDRPQSTTPGQDDTGEPSQAQEGELELYRLAMSGDVRLSQGGRSVRSSEATIHARTFGGRLRDGAIRPLDIPVQGETEQPAAAGASTAKQPAPVDDEIVLEWSGPLELRLLPDAPVVLRDDDLHVRFTSPESSVVELSDEASGATARGAALEYGFTSRNLVLAGIGGVGVRVLVPEVVEFVGGRLEADLDELPVGVGAAPSPGRVTSLGDDPAEISWEGRADFAFSLARFAGESGVVFLPSTVAFSGGVSAQQDESDLRGQHLRASFRPVEGGRVGLAEIAVSGSVFAASPTRSGLARIEADDVRVLFDPASSAEGPMPVAATASGSVRGEHAGRVLTAGNVDTTMKDDGAGNVVVTRVVAEIGVTLSTPDGLKAIADSMTASVEEETADLLGAPAQIEQMDGAVAYAIEGPSIRIEGADRRMTVFGAGAASYRDVAGGDEQGRLEWNTGMTYDDVEGLADAFGGIVATRSVGVRERQVAEAERALIEVTAYDPEREPQRSLIRITLEATDEDTPAKVESRRYAAGRQPELETLVALRGPRIIANHDTQLLETPGSGLLLVEDRRTRSPNPTNRRDDATRGTSVFEWAGRMLLDRNEGTARMERDVRVRHLHPDSEQYTELVCELVEATLDPTRIETADSARTAPEIQSILAKQAVYLRHMQTELVCDEMLYEASSDELIVTAIQPNRITVLDREKGRHFTAEQLFLDLTTGSWRATKGRSVEAGINTAP
jgi:hypothetical protein